MIRSTFSEQLIDGFLVIVKTGPLDPFEGFSKIDKTTLGGHRKNAERARDPESFAAGNADAVAIIHQYQVSAEFDSKCYSVFFACVEFFHGSIMHMRGVMHTSAHDGGSAIHC